MPPQSFANLVSVLRHRATSKPDDLAYRYLGDTLGPTRLTWRDLNEQVNRVAAHLVAEGVAPGDRAMLLFPDGLEFLSAFLGCLAAGAVAVPAPPPHPHKPHRSVQRLGSILSAAEPAWLLTTSEMIEAIEPAITRLPGYQRVRWVRLDQLDDAPARDVAAPRSQDVAWIQYTSGSTSDPKGAAITHANALHNLAAFDHGWNHDDGTTIVNWLPAFHDLGLVYGLLAPMFFGVPSVQLSAYDVVVRPRTWLEAITTCRGTHSAAPNFMYDLCVKRIAPAETRTLDLSRWRVALNAAEPIRAQTIDRFTGRFADAGFRRTTFCTGYGLSEATCKVTALSSPERPRTLIIEARHLERGVVRATSPGHGSRTVVGCGKPVADVNVRIVDPEARTLMPPDRVGEIWVQGPGVASQFWGNPESTKSHLQAHLAQTDGHTYLRTGDLGFLHEDELYVTGRIKDLIIVRGANHYPQDIEATVLDAHASLRPGSCAAFSFEEDGEERVAVVVEVEPARRHLFSAREAKKAVNRAVVEQHGVRISRLAFIRAGTLPKTTSGKVQRYAAKQALLDGALVRVTPEPARRRPDPEEVRAQMREKLIAIISDAAGLPAAEITPKVSLHSLGVDSLAGVSIAYEIGVFTGKKVPSTLLAQHDTLEALTDYVLAKEPPAALVGAS